MDIKYLWENGTEDQWEQALAEYKKVKSVEKYKIIELSMENIHDHLDVFSQKNGEGF